MISHKDRFATKLLSAFISIAMVASLMSAPGIAWAAGTDDAASASAQAQTEGESSAAEESQPSSIDRVSESVSISSASDAAQSSAAADATPAPSASEAASESDADASSAQQQTSSLPVTDQAASDTDVEMVSAELSLNGEGAQTAITYNGLAYMLNEDGMTVTLTGLATKAPAGDVQIPAEVPVGSAAYAVTNICTLRGGGIR